MKAGYYLVEVRTGRVKKPLLGPQTRQDLARLKRAQILYWDAERGEWLRKKPPTKRR